MGARFAGGVAVVLGAGSSGLVMLSLLRVLGWPLWVSALAALLIVWLFAKRGLNHWRLLVDQADRSTPDVFRQHVGLLLRVWAVQAAVLAGCSVGYFAAAVCFRPDAVVVGWLAGSPGSGSVFGPPGSDFWEKHRSPSSLPFMERFPPEWPGLLGFLRYPVAVVAGFAAGKGLRYLLVPPADSRRGARGRTLLSYAEALEIARRRLPRNDPGLYWGGLLLPSMAATSHFVATGTTGSGKTITIRLLAQSALPKIGCGLDQRALIYDAKQDTVSHLYGMGLQCRIDILNPFDARCSAWDIAADCTSPALALQIAGILIPEERGTNRFFSDASRELLKGALMSMMRTCPGRWDLRDVILAAGNAKAIKALNERLPETRQNLQFFAAEITAANIVSTLASLVGPLEPIAATWSHAQRRISLQEWVHGESVIVMGNDARIGRALQSINRVFFQRASELLLGRPDSETRRSWVFLDEVREAGKLDSLCSLMTNGRTRGVAVCLGFQDIEGLRDVYGVLGANEIVGQCNSKALLRVESPETAKWASASVGEFEQYEKTVSNTTSRQGGSRTVNEQLAKRDAVLPSEFMAVPPTTRENGLTGYYLCGHIGAYRATIAGEDIDAMLLPPDPSVDNFEERPVEQQWLAPWTEEDCQRLGLDVSVLQDGRRRPSSAAQPPKTLQVVGRKKGP